MSSKKIVLVFGATGWVGGKVVDLLLQRSDEVTVKAFVRPTSDKKSLMDKGVGVVEGDLLQKDSLEKAFSADSKDAKDGVDVVIYCAATYMARRKGDTQAQDMIAFKSVVDAAKAGKIRRFVLTSVVACEKAVNVPHFHDKYLQEQYLKATGIPFISVRTGMFIDQTPQNDFLWSSLKTNFVPVVLHRTNVKMQFVHTDDYANALCRAAIDIPDEEIPWVKVLNFSAGSMASWEDIAAEFSRQLGRPIIAQAPAPGLSYILPVAGMFNELVHDLTLMFKFIDSGQFVIDDWADSKKYLGDLPTIQDTVTKYLVAQRAAGHDLSPEPPSLMKKMLPVLLIVILAAGVYYLSTAGK